MNPILLANLIGAIGYIPQGLALVQKIYGDIQAGRTATTVTAEDLAELTRLSELTSKVIYARAGVALPPPAA